VTNNTSFYKVIVRNCVLNSDVVIANTKCSKRQTLYFMDRALKKSIKLLRPIVFNVAITVHIGPIGLHDS